MELNGKFQFAYTILAFVGLLAPGGSTCALCDLTNGAASACGTTALFPHRHHGDSLPLAPAVLSKQAAVHHHGKPTNAATGTWKGGQAFSATHSSCCQASNLLSLSVQAAATPQNRGSPVSRALALRIICGPVVVHAVSKPEVLPSPPISSEQAFLCVFLV